MNSAVETIPGEPPHAHHWTSVNAYHGAKLGMWLFLATEILLFSVLFTSFAIYRFLYLGEFHSASLQLDWRMGATNTAVLIISSFTAALAMDAAQHGNNKRVRNLLLFTVACGGIFLVVKYFEYSHKYDIGLFPGRTCPEV
ncbi:MAG: cytochrome c oxidase subunit 3, partial [Candidatus Omnitrophica bacterium]|nr:cytochrome c oxidase subunit 3 [Candidatus Omnitrophota bacterium]